MIRIRWFETSCRHIRRWSKEARNEDRQQNACNASLPISVENVGTNPQATIQVSSRITPTHSDSYHARRPDYPKLRLHRVLFHSKWPAINPPYRTCHGQAPSPLHCPSIYIHVQQVTRHGYHRHKESLISGVLWDLTRRPKTYTHPIQVKPPIANTTQYDT